MTDPNCLFCRIVARQIPAKVVYEDDRAVAFEDVNPQAPVHLLVVPRRHLATLTEAAEADAALVGDLTRVAARLAQAHGVAESGYRVVVNVNRDANQTVFHLHLHVLGGRPFGWPPG